MGLNSPNELNGLVASQIHAYYRLAHHLSPRMFADDRNLAGAITLLLLMSMTAAYYCFIGRRLSRDKLRLDATAWILTVAWNAILVALFGVLIDQLYSRSHPVFASQLLRFYWFRWFDIVAPLAWTLTFWKLTERYTTQASQPFGDVSPSQSRSDLIEHSEHVVTPKRPLRDDSAQQSQRLALVFRGAQWIALAILLAMISVHVQSNFERRIPAADDSLMKAPVLREIETDRFVDWRAACEWIRQNSPADSLWFTPEYQQTFKWYAGRAEVVCWKDVPQDNASVRAWYERLVHCRQPRNAAGERIDWNCDQILELAKEYGFRWVLIDRRLQRTPLEKFEIMYPIKTENKSFAVFRIPEFYFETTQTDR